MFTAASRFLAVFELVSGCCILPSRPHDPPIGHPYTGIGNVYITALNEPYQAG
jgi:hypothetical protein